MSPSQKRTGDGSSNAEATVNDRTGLFIAILALTLGAFSCGIAATLFVIMPTMIDTKVLAAIAPVTEQTRTSTQNARLALDRADKISAALEAKGLIRLENH